MTAAEWVDKDFTLEGNTTRSLCKAVNAYVKSLGLESEGFHPSGAAMMSTTEVALPLKFTYLIAYCIEGGSEGWYVHMGAIIRGGDYGQTPPTYQDFAFVKVWDADTGHAVATAAQRFLSAIVWN